MFILYFRASFLRLYQSERVQKCRFLNSCKNCIVGISKQAVVVWTIVVAVVESVSLNSPAAYSTYSSKITRSSSKF